MLKKLFYSTTIIISLPIDAQVGINTNSPKGVFHINSSSNTDENDDITVSSQGNISVGHTTPTVKVDIKTTGTTNTPLAGFKLEDGSQASGRVLHSDENGIAKWEDIVLFNKNPIVGTFTWPANRPVGTTASSPNNYAGNTRWNSISSISVPPGTHMIYIKLHILNTPDTGFLRTYVGTKDLGTNNANASDTPILGGTNFQPYISKDFEMTQSFVYTNTTTNNVRLFFNIQSDSPSIRRSIYTFNNIATFMGVNLMENYFFSVPAS